MFAFGSAVTKPDVYARCARPGIERAAEPDSVILPADAAGSVFASYNAQLDRAAALDGLEGLVLVHQDAELVDADLCAILRTAFADPSVGLAGCVGAVGVHSIAWWEGSVTLANFVNRYDDEHGRGDLEAFSWDPATAPPYAHTGEVETLDGFALAFSPWAVREVRFDAALGGFHGYDLDYCLQVRERGRRVVTADFRAIHHRPLEMIPDLDEWRLAHATLARKWDGRMPRVGDAPGTWRERALRAEAEADAARAVAAFKRLELDARVAELEGALRAATTSLGWRATAPLRRAGGA